MSSMYLGYAEDYCYLDDIFAADDKEINEILNIKRELNPLDVKMKFLGFDFVTNFESSLEDIYHIAAKKHNLQYRIMDVAYDYLGQRLPKYIKSFYVKRPKNLSDFWNTFEDLCSKRGIMLI